MLKQVLQGHRCVGKKKLSLIELWPIFLLQVFPPVKLFRSAFDNKYPPIPLLSSTLLSLSLSLSYMCVFVYPKILKFVCNSQACLRVRHQHISKRSDLSIFLTFRKLLLLLYLCILIVFFQKLVSFT